MKIVCDSCGAKYSIADEKVAGKIFKIRCKKCSSVLEVRGDQTGAHALETASQPQDPVAEAGWYIVVDAEQRGPLTPIELSQLFAKGSVGLDSYVWKEGFDDWKVAAEVPELVQILGGAGSAAKGETSKITTDSSASFGTGGDLFTDGNGREPTGEIITHGEGSVFGDPSDTAGEPMAAEEAPVAAAAAAESAAAEGFGAAIGGGAGAEPARMTGQRNENSVLFSLSNLQQLASRGGGAEPVAQPVQTQAAASPQAAGEGSGLIDIRALAKSTTPGTRTAPSQAVDDLLALGTAGGGGTLGAPLLGPTPIESSSSNRWLWIAGIAVAIVGTVGMGLGLGVMLGGSGDDDGLEVAGEEQTPAPGETAVAMAAPTDIDEQPAEVADAEPEQAAAFEEPAEEPLEAPDFEEPQQARAKPTKQRTTSRRRRTRTASSAAAAAPAPAPTKRRSGNNLDALMDEVVGGSSAKKSAPAAARSGGSGSSLPEAPSRGDVKTALQGVSGGVKSCNKGTGGTALVDVTFSGGTGRVSRAKITSGPLKGTPTGACVEKAVKRARVPRFKQSAFKVKFPYRL